MRPSPLTARPLGRYRFDRPDGTTLDLDAPSFIEACGLALARGVADTSTGTYLGLVAELDRTARLWRQDARP